jgi:hypothetical protein
MSFDVDVDPEIVHVREAGELSTFPEASLPRTSKVCVPAARPEYVRGDVQAVNAAPSRRHSNVEPDSVEVKPNEASVDVTVPLGPLVIAVSGGVVSPGGGVDVLWLQLSA